MIGEGYQIMTAFLSDAGTTLHLAIPALEALHKAWSSHYGWQKYALFTPALPAAAQKIDEYHEKMTDSPTYVVAMCLFFWYLYSVSSNFFVNCSTQSNGENGILQK